MHVLFLTPWYPNRHDAMDGLFVRKHAQAVARQGVSVSAIRVRTDDEARGIEIETAEVEGVLEVMAYTSSAKAPALRQATAMINFVRGFVKAYRAVVRLRGKPDVVQVNVLTRMGVMAYALKRLAGIPYVVIEHWTRYQPSQGQYRGFARKWATELACRNARCVMTVSENLGRVMRGCGIKAKDWLVVRNVVSDFFYSDPLRRQSDGTCRLLCVTTANERCKNTTGLLNAAARIASCRRDFHLTIAGMSHDTVASVGRAADVAELSDLVTFAGEVSPEQVSRLMHESDALVMFSNAENAPCVISEAQASGLPVIATTVGGIPEMVSPSTGILVEPGDEAALAKAMTSVIDGTARFDEVAVTEAGRKYSFDEVGRQLTAIYSEAAGDISSHDGKQHRGKA